VVSTFAMAAAILLVPAIVAGSVFPFLLLLLEGTRHSAGEALGRWFAANTLGGVAGSTAAGFVLLDLVGLWGGIEILAAAYLGLFVLVAHHGAGRGTLARAGLSAVVAGVLLASAPSRSATVRLDPETDELVELLEGGSGLVSVIRSHPAHYPEGYDDLFIRLDANYTLGGKGSLPTERRQAHLPLLLHPQPRSIFFLGLGTGITAGAALGHPVDAVVATEIVPEVVAAARGHFGRYTNGLFEDARARVVVEDGRNFLLGTTERYDVIVGDLFDPRAADAGLLYSREHFELVRSRLASGGLFAQWLPLYQLGERELATIVRTFLDVFEQATLWRGDFSPDESIVALVGQLEPVALDPDVLVAHTRALAADPLQIDLLLSLRGLSVLAVNPEGRAGQAALTPQLSGKVPFTFYAGNLRLSEDRFAAHEPHTDDRPVVTFRAPGARRGDPVTGFRLDRVFEELLHRVPLEADPYLARLDPDQLDHVRAGLSYYRSILHHEAGDQAQAERHYVDYLQRMGLLAP
jgi:spermidine synthase